ncbi:MAG: hypothetical protein ACETV1_07535 [Candidatus Bathyarchaeia archaeon]
MSSSSVITLLSVPDRCVSKEFGFRGVWRWSACSRVFPFLTLDEEEAVVASI